MDMLHFGGWLGEYDGSESDFAGKLSRQIPTVSGEEADNMMEVVYRAAYGSDDGSRDKDYETVKSVYDKVAVQVYQNQTACKKFLFRCLKMYFV